MRIKQYVIINVLIVTVMILTNLIFLINSVQASNITEIPEIQLHSRGVCGQLLKYKGVIVKTTYVEYTYEGKNYPAYCLDKTLQGITSELEYFVGTSKKIDDVGLWRIIINGYPYKTLQELGVANDEEAFTATKQAIYCYLFENTPSDYEPIGEAGNRTLSALNQILTNGENSKEIQNITNAVVNSENEDWIQDEENEEYIYKTYYLISELDNLDYEIESIKNLPKESKITNLDGKETMKFSKNEKFKIILKKEELKNDGTFNLNIKTQLKTKPVIYGASPDASWQNYALTGYMYEEKNTSLEDSYKKIEKPTIPIKEEKTEKNVKNENVKILPVTGM